MEKGASPTIGFNISSSKNSDDDVVSLTKLHSSESFPSKITMMSFHHQENRRGVGGGGGGGGGPTGSNSGGANEVVGHMYHDGVSSSSLSGENFGTNSKPFDIFAASHKSPEGMMAANMVFPFTFAQWKELERQAMIYKYMISSVPVPPHLLYPLSRNFPDSSMYNVRYSKNGDPEPGRCKRTDGKKWRCSRDVAPHQKYCERHLHRGRPRSRKPVEVKNNGENNKKARVVTQSNLPNSSASQHFDAVNDKPLLLFNPTKSDLNISNAPSYKGTTRDLGLMMEGEMVVMDGAEQQWQHLIKANAGFTDGGSSIYGCNSLLNHDFVEQQPLNVLSYSNFPAPGIDAPTGFIDAWSINNLNSSNNGNVESSISTNHGNLSPSLTLSIAMAAGSILDQEMATIKCCDDQNTNESRWLNPVSWEPFAQGGPLAEALQPGSSACKNPASPHDSLSTAATTVSSPTGVLQRTLFSHSDGSVCNSPTFPAPPSEVAFQRLN